MFDTVLIANRGEIAVRISRTLDDMGIRSVAVYSDADANAPHVRSCTEAVRIGPAEARDSYLNIPAIIAAARQTGAQAIHPGYGFLSENPAFARACAEADIVFLGPSPQAIETMGDKIAARKAVEARGVPTVPGIVGASDDEILGRAGEIGYPMIVKPAMGGGGKGMHVVRHERELRDALQTARREAAKAFGDDTVFVERFIERPRHIEVQVMADSHGNVVHLGERECSLQRRHQKVIEEAPSAFLTPEQREHYGQIAIETARSVNYVGAGTVEFIVASDSPDEPFFLEMNTRLQVEHPVTEEVTGLDLVELMVEIGAGRELPFAQSDVQLRGHSIEARIYAEDPGEGFLPTGGTIERLDYPYTRDQPVRFDSGVESGSTVTSHYDPMLAKVIVHADDRAGALRLLDEALRHLFMPGVVTNTGFLVQLLQRDEVRRGAIDTEFIDRNIDSLTDPSIPQQAFVQAAWALTGEPSAHRATAWHDDGWRMSGHNAWDRYRFVGATVLVDPRCGDVRIEAEDSVLRTDPEPEVFASFGWTSYTAYEDGEQFDDPGFVAARAAAMADAVPNAEGDAERAEAQAAMYRTGTLPDESQFETFDDSYQPYRPSGGPSASHTIDDAVWVRIDGETFIIERRRAAAGALAAGEAAVSAPMPGSVVAVAVADGDHVAAGQHLLSVEAMKMEHRLTASQGGVVRLSVAEGDQVTRGQELARIEAEDAQ